MSAANKEIIRAFMEEVLNQGRFERMNDLVKEDFVELDPFPGQQPGREGLKAVLMQMKSAFPDIHWVIQETISEGDKVVTRFTWSGTHRDTFLGIPATGKPVEVKGVVIDRLEAGKMADSRILMDTLGLMQQLGILPAPAPAA
ncbi:MAG: ester cyclase [Terracidiphilus sp.]